MAQKRFWNFKDDDSTFDLSRWLVGLHEPGVYRGFNFVPGAGMTMVLSMAPDGMVRTLLDGTESAPTGIIVSKQGVVIHEDSNITIPIVPNNTGSTRLDIIICSHQYSPNVEGGLPATYSVVTGSGVPNIPSPPNPNTDIVLGILMLPPNTSSLIAAQFTRSPTPHFNGKPDYFANDMAYSSNNYIVDGETVKRSLERIDGALKTTNNRLPVVKADEDFPTVYVEQDLTPILAGRKEFIIKVNSVFLGVSANINRILQPGFYNGEGFGHPIESFSDYGDFANYGALSFSLIVNTFLGDAKGSPVTFSYQTLHINFLTEDADEVVSLTRLLTNDGEFTDVGKWALTSDSNRGKTKVDGLTLSQIQPNRGTITVASTVVKTKKLAPNMYLVDFLFRLDLGGLPGNDVDYFDWELPQGLVVANGLDFHSIGYNQTGGAPPLAAGNPSRDWIGARSFQVRALGGTNKIRCQAHQLPFNDAGQEGLYQGQIIIETNNR